MGPLARGLIVFLGAGIGGSLRFWLGQWIALRAGLDFPWHTLFINVSGSFLIGLAVGRLSGEALGWRLFLVAGLLGGYTTFSAFSLETVELIRKGNMTTAMANAAGSCFLGFVACWAGQAAAQAWPRN